MLVALCALAGVSRSAGAQTSPRSPAPLDAATRREVIDTVSAQVERIYVDADTGRMIGTHVRDRLAAGAYDTVSDPRLLARLLTADLRTVNHDLHLSVAYTAPDPTATAGPQGGGALAFLARSNHFALGRVDVLPGNIGYLEINGFATDQAARDVLVGALRYLQTTDAIILDLRRNRGGNAGLVNFLISHFTGPDTLASVTVKFRASDRATTRYTLASVPGPRRPDVPLYVLTSRMTGSAGEDCAFVLKNLKRATIIGDRTAGAGHNVTFVPSGHGFQTGISFSRVSDPRTGQEWEQIGVQPDVKVDVATALDVAQSLALKTLAEQSNAGQRAPLDLIRETIEARIHVRDVPAEKLASYAGTYEGNRRVTIVGGRLTYETAGGAPEQAVALSDSAFALSSQVRLVFEFDAQGKVRLRMVNPDGTVAMFARVQ